MPMTKPGAEHTILDVVLQKSYRGLIHGVV